MVKGSYLDSSCVDIFAEENNSVDLHRGVRWPHMVSVSNNEENAVPMLQVLFVPVFCTDLFADKWLIKEAVGEVCGNAAQCHVQEESVVWLLEEAPRYHG